MTSNLEGKSSKVQDGKAAGPYSIPVKLLKIISHQISIPFCMIINDSFCLEFSPINSK